MRTIWLLILLHAVALVGCAATGRNVGEAERTTTYPDGRVVVEKAKGNAVLADNTSETGGIVITADGITFGKTKLYRKGEYAPFYYAAILCLVGGGVAFFYLKLPMLGAALGTGGVLSGVAPKIIEAVGALVMPLLVLGVLGAVAFGIVWVTSGHHREKHVRRSLGLPGTPPK